MIKRMKNKWELALRLELQDKVKRQRHNESRERESRHAEKCSSKM